MKNDVPDLALGEDVVRRLCDRVGVEVETEVPQELLHESAFRQSNSDPLPKSEIHPPPQSRAVG